MSQLNLRKRKRVCYYEPEEPPFDEYIFCTECRDYVYEYCSIHGPLLVVPDDKVPTPTGYPPIVPRAALTIPRVFLHLAASRIPGAGIGVFSTLTLPVGVRFGPYRGTRLPPGPGSYYGWQILDSNHKPSHMVDARDPNTSNWMRYVNCSRHHSEQNLVAYQYKGQLYYRTVKVIPRFTELLVFYGSEFARELGVDLRHYRAACPCAHCRAQQPENPAPIKMRKRPAQTNVKPVKEKIAKKSTIEKKQQAPIITAVKKQQNGDENIEPTVQPMFNMPFVTVNKNNEEQLKQKAIFMCDQCKESFELKKDLEEHVLTHLLNVKKTDDGLTKSNTKTKCDKCNISFDTSTELVKHLSTHLVKIKTSAGNYTCKSCNSKFETNNNLMEHMESQHSVKRLVCTECDYITIYEHCLARHQKTHTYKSEKCDYKANCSSSLKQHLMSAHAGVKPFKCTHCNYACSRKGLLVRHERTHTGEKPYKCDICDYKAARSNSLKQHLMSAHAGVKPFKCRQCNYSCSQKCNLVRHERTHTGQKPYKCDICDYKATQSISLKRHLTSVHAGVKPFKCRHCKYACSCKGDLVKHERTHTGEKPYKCDICDYKAAQSIHLKRHLMSVHAGVKPFKCTQCNYACSQKGNLVRHERTHTGEKPYKCDICDYKAVQSNSLKRHLTSVHAGVKHFKCRHCNYACSRKCHLVRHERTHTGEKPYKCDICDYKAAHSISLKLHLMSVHAGVKPFKCTLCNYACSMKGHLAQHERTHTGEKPYECDICDYKAALSIHLKRHLMSVHAGVKPFKCIHCKYACSEKCNLVRHERTHTGETPYKCDICDYKAARSNSLKQHVMRTHALEKP